MQPGLREIYGLSTDDHQAPRKDIQNLLDEHKISSIKQLEKLIEKKTKLMRKAASKLQFEEAAELRDMIEGLKDRLLVFMESDGV
jgi:excinuclease UvrABC helicase subunit UvrB